MGHYAKILQGKVIQVIVAEPEFFNTFTDTSPGTYIQCSYNTRGGVYYLPDSDTPSPDQTQALRKNYPGIGWVYDEELDMFREEKPYPSWTLDLQSGLWEPPIPKPPHGPVCSCHWDEENQTWTVVASE